MPGPTTPVGGRVHGRDQQAVDRRSAGTIAGPPGQPERIEHEYVRNGVAQIFLEVELDRRSHVEAAERRTRQDWARWIGVCWRSDIRRPSGWSWSWTNTHGIESLYARAPTRPPIGGTTRNSPKHGLAQHCGNRTEHAVRSMPRPPDSKSGPDATRDRGLSGIGINAKPRSTGSSTEDARIKLKILYPQL